MRIRVNGPAYRGAEMPKFERLMINESRFSDGERYKEYDIEFNPESRSTIEWLCQEETYHSAGWSEEIKRAFKANGAKPGHVIDVLFGSRDEGYVDEFELEID